MSRMRRKLVAGVALSMALAGCINEDGTVETPPLATVTGQVTMSDNLSPVNPHVGLVWVGVDESSYDLKLALDAAPLPEGFPAQFSLSVFQPPPDDVRIVFVDSNGVVNRYATAYVLAFEDQDGDGAFAVDENGLLAPDRMFGLSVTEFLMYFESEPSEEMSSIFTNPEAAHQGFVRVHLDFCSGAATIVDASTPVDLVTFDPDDEFLDIEGIDCGWDVVTEPPDGWECPDGSDSCMDAFGECVKAAADACQEGACAYTLDAYMTCAEAAGGSRSACYEEVEAFNDCLNDCIDFAACRNAG